MRRWSSSSSSKLQYDCDSKVDGIWLSCTRSDLCACLIGTATQLEKGARPKSRTRSQSMRSASFGFGAPFSVAVSGGAKSLPKGTESARRSRERSSSCVEGISICLRIFLFSPVGFKGNLSLLETTLVFAVGLSQRKCVERSNGLT